jgi:hypothetical protein
LKALGSCSAQEDGNEGMETAMSTKVMKWASIAALPILAVLNSRSLADYRTALAALVVFAGAIVVLVQSTSTLTT